MAYPVARGKAVGDALIAYLQDRLLFNVVGGNPLKLVSLDWFRGNVGGAMGSYPANPYTMCDRLLLTLTNQRITPQVGQGGKAHFTTLNYAFTYQRRQNKDENHQQLLVAASESIFNPFLADVLAPPNLQAVAGFVLIECLPGTIQYGGDLTHPEWDDENLRISVSEISLEVTGRIVGG